MIKTKHQLLTMVQQDTKREILRAAARFSIYGGMTCIFIIQTNEIGDYLALHSDDLKLKFFRYSNGLLIIMSTVFIVYALLKLMQYYYEYKIELEKIRASREILENPTAGLYVQKVRATRNTILSSVIVAALYLVPAGFIINYLIKQTPLSALLYEKAIFMSDVVAWSIIGLLVLYCFGRLINYCDRKVQDGITHSQGTKKVAYILLSKLITVFELPVLIVGLFLFFLKSFFTAIAYCGMKIVEFIQNKFHTNCQPQSTSPSMSELFFNELVSREMPFGAITQITAREARESVWFALGVVV